MFKPKLHSVFILVIAVCGFNFSPSTIKSHAVLSKREERSKPNEQAESQSAAVSCSIVLQKAIYTAGEPIVATLLISNDTAQIMHVNLGFDREGVFSSKSNIRMEVRLDFRKRRPEAACRSSLNFRLKLRPGTRSNCFLTIGIVLQALVCTK